MQVVVVVVFVVTVVEVAFKVTTVVAIGETTEFTVEVTLTVSVTVVQTVARIVFGRTTVKVLVSCGSVTVTTAFSVHVIVECANAFLLSA